MEMIALTREGDTKHEWNTDNEDERAQAQILFDEYRKQGFAAFRMSDTERNSALTEFDPTAGTILFIPMVAGG